MLKIQLLLTRNTLFDFSEAYKKIYTFWLTEKSKNFAESGQDTVYDPQEVCRHQKTVKNLIICGQK